MEGRGYSGFYRNTSEELFIKTMMESPVGIPAPTMEMLGFKNLAHNLRTDSEELFKSWLTNGENNGSHSTGIAHRPRQASRRISTEPASLTKQNCGLIQKRPDVDVHFTQTSSVAADSSNDLNPSRTGIDKGLQASNLFLAKAWFHSSQPMTRSRSSELRRRYVAMQSSQTPIGMEAMHEASVNGVNNFKQEHMEANSFNGVPMFENPDQFSAFMSPSNSSSSNFNNPQVGCVDKISSVVRMLKGTLERKKLNNQVENEAIDQDSSFGYYKAEELLGEYENHGNLQGASTFGVTENEVLQKIEESLMEDIMGPTNLAQTSAISQEPSLSESSTAPPLVGDDPCVSAQAPSVCESSRNQTGNRTSSEDCYRAKDFRERTYDSSKDDRKKGGLVRYGSVKSTGSADRGDPTKNRRVERSRKMAEAKERCSIPALPSDTQSILKRCENLEKEVRSLKLNLAFMNRKDSEQTKQIEELQKQNLELANEKERLLEEIERIVADTGKM